MTRVRLVKVKWKNGIYYAKRLATYEYICKCAINQATVQHTPHSTASSFYSQMFHTWQAVSEKRKLVKNKYKKINVLCIIYNVAVCRVFGPLAIAWEKMKLDTTTSFICWYLVTTLDLVWAAFKPLSQVKMAPWYFKVSILTQMLTARNEVLEILWGMNEILLFCLLSIIRGVQSIAIKLEIWGQIEHDYCYKSWNSKEINMIQKLFA